LSIVLNTLVCLCNNSGDISYVNNRFSSVRIDALDVIPGAICCNSSEGVTRITIHVPEEVEVLKRVRNKVHTCSHMGYLSSSRETQINEHERNQMYQGLRMSS